MIESTIYQCKKADRSAQCSARLPQKRFEPLYALRVAREYCLDTRNGLPDVLYDHVRWAKSMCVLELGWARKARCCVLHCLHWKPEIVALKLFEEAH